MATVSRAKTDINEETLKAAFSKCTQQYDDKYGAGIFNKNVTLTQDETKEINKLLEKAKKAHELLKSQESLFSKFEKILDQRRAKLGTLNENRYILDDSKAMDVTKELVGVIPAIRVPTRVKHIYAWGNVIDSVREELNDYEKGLAKGRLAKPFGKEIKELYRFVNETGK